jgi:SAM-dependent methyltransferase
MAISYMGRALGALRGRRPVNTGGPNLLGDRDVEWSWVAALMPPGPGQALDFGNGGGSLGLLAAQRGFDVTAIDIGAVTWPYIHPRLCFVQGDLLRLDLPHGHYDLVVNCSTVEHVGLVGRYDVVDDRADGDLDAMARLRELLRPGGTMLLTIPLGRDRVFAPMCRVYGQERLPRLLAGYDVKSETYWVKDETNRWVLADRAAATSYPASVESWDAHQNVYALGCFVLRRPAVESSTR